MSRHYESRENLERIKKLAAQGLERAVIAERLGLTRGAVNTALRNDGKYKHQKENT